MARTKRATSSLAPVTSALEADDRPSHYQGEITPWHLQRCMLSSGNAFIDARRADMLKYAFRMKGNLLKDLKKARHCLDAAIEVLEAEEAAQR